MAYNHQFNHFSTSEQEVAHALVSSTRIKETHFRKNSNREERHELIAERTRAQIEALNSWSRLKAQRRTDTVQIESSDVITIEMTNETALGLESRLQAIAMRHDQQYLT